MRGHWSLSDISWDSLVPRAVEAALLRAVKTAALVEANSVDYVTYLHNVFVDDVGFKHAATRWGEEERQHGAALGRWAELIDPDFDFEQRLAHFRAGYRIPLAATRSVRGSNAAELVARCVVESGTCSYYSALRDTTREPVLREICHRIAQDEARHYQLFHVHLQRYLQSSSLGRLQRIKVALGRVAETTDDELAHAYFSANVPSLNAPACAYDRAACARAYQRIVTNFYQRKHLQAAAHMVARAAGLAPNGPLVRAGVRVGWMMMRRWRETPGSAAGLSPLAR